MRVILLDNIKNLGRLGETIKVKPGYGRNYLIPQQKAVFATKANMAMFEERRSEFERQAIETLQAAQKRAEEFLDKKISIVAKASEEGKLYGSVGTREIARSAKKMGLVIEPSEIILSNGTIRMVGEHTITISLHNDVRFPLIVEVIAE